jgi:hypothetical protein
MDATRPCLADAWTFGGPLYFPIGGGIRIGVTENIGLMLGAKVHFAVINPAFMFGFAPEVGFQYGF